MKNRRKSEIVHVGGIPVGGDSPIPIQTMWKGTINSSSKSILEKVYHLKEMGCEILRFAVPNIESADKLGSLSESSPIPLVADIHFDYRIAIRCLDYPIAKVRINPGNIGSSDKVKKVFQKASQKGVPIRIGVNAGSLPPDLIHQPDKAEAMVIAAERELKWIQEMDFHNIIISLKSSDINTTVQANRIFSSHYNYPLHLGVTEAGPVIPGIIRNTIALNKLLEEGIGDTIRISLSGTMEEEIIAGKELLRAAGHRNGGITVISCPRCGRRGFDVTGFLREMSDLFEKSKKDLTVAVMGCEVNGPGEAREADIGITGSGNSVVLFRKGKILKKTDSQHAKEEFLKVFNDLCR
jgi:(E)-4-hydroxy-3-methylbut-2-enyl-diphosphate synthase